MAKRIYLNNDWKFSQEFSLEMLKSDYDYTDMVTVRIPHTVRETPFHYFDEHEYQMVSGYVKKINVPKEWEDKAIRLTIDYGELKNNRRDESVIFSMQTFVVKLASGVAALIASICLEISNISKNTEDVVTQAAGTSSVMVLRMTMALLPIIGLLIALLVFKKKFILTEEKINEITKTLKGE